MSRPKVEDPQKRTGTKGLSITPELFEKAEDRVGQLYPLVKGFSAYVQLLIELDHANKVIEQAVVNGTLPGRPDGAPRLPKLRGAQKN